MAKLKYTFDDYINNPSGKGSAVLASINKDTYNSELLSLESKNGKTKYDVYRQSKIGGNVMYLIHFQIPSSTTKGFFHDVVIEFTPNPKDSITDKTIKKYHVRFFCNDDNFVYTYAYAFKSHGVLINELEKLLPFRSISQKPTMRNPDNAMGYNKSIIFAYLIMNRDNLFLKDNLSRISKNAGINAIKNNIKSFDKKNQERNKITQEIKNNDKKDDKTKKSKIVKSKNLLGDIGHQPLPKITKITGNTKLVKKISGVKKAKKR